MTKDWPSAVAQTLPDQVVRTILGRITCGDLRPGSRLPAQRELAQSMGVGLAVIREAVKRLEALDIIATVHGSGSTVRPFRWMPMIYDGAHLELAVQSIGIRDLWEARLVLESRIALLAAQRATRADLDALAAVVARADPLPAHYAASQALNREFHLALAGAAQNAVLTDLIAPLLDVHVASAAPHFTRETCRRTWAAHRAILAAVSARDVRATERAMARHFAIGPIALQEAATRARRGRR